MISFSHIKSINDLPKKKRKQVEEIVALMSKEEREAWDEMSSKDLGLLITCLLVQRKGGGIFNCDGIKKHFKLSRALLGYND